MTGAGQGRPLASPARSRSAGRRLGAIFASEATLWGAGMLSLGLILTDCGLILRAETRMRDAAEEAALALASGRVDAHGAAALARLRLDLPPTVDMRVSVSHDASIWVELRMPSAAATLFGLNGFLTSEQLVAQASADPRDRLAATGD